MTRILIQEPQGAVLKARLPDPPEHPRALETLAEGIALWCGRPLYCALGVAAEDALCVSPGWHATVETVTRTPLVTIEPAIGLPRRPWRVTGRGSQESQRSLARRLRHYATRGLLIIDEVGYLSYHSRAADLLFQVVSRRYEHRSLVLTTNLPFSGWPTIFPNATSATALIDRLVHHAEILTIEGQSFRRRAAAARRKSVP